MENDDVNDDEYGDEYDDDDVDENVPDQRGETLHASGTSKSSVPIQGASNG